MTNLCRKNNRRYFIVEFDGCTHNLRIDIIKRIPSIKFRKNCVAITFHSIMIGCNGIYCETLLSELTKAKNEDGYCDYFEWKR